MFNEKQHPLLLLVHAVQCSGEDVELQQATFNNEKFVIYVQINIATYHLKMRKDGLAKYISNFALK